MSRKLERLLPLAFFILITFILEFLTHQKIIASYLFPAPSEILSSLVQDLSEYLIALKLTLLASLLGLTLAIFTGLGFALILSYSKFLEKVFYPYAIFFQTVPIIAIAPILVIWFGFGLPTVIASSAIVSVFPIVANSLAGLQSTDPALLDLFFLYAPNKKLTTLFKLKLPYAVPQIITGVKVSAGLALIGAIVGEFIAGGGLGGLIDMARTQQRLDKVFASVLLASFAGILFMTCIQFFSKLLFKKFRLN